MAVKPIIFSGPMVKALLAGTKTQTRRLIKPQPPSDVVRHCWFHAPIYGFTADADITANWHTARLLAQGGDLLYVREACAMWTGDHKDVVYRADETEAGWKALLHDARSGYWKTAPSIHMPRVFSRLTLEVSEVRVQRLQDISEEDARAEGVRGNAGGEWGCEGLIEEFAGLWDSLHGEGAWDRNDWIAAYTFTVHQANVDDLLRQREAA